MDLGKLYIEILCPKQTKTTCREQCINLDYCKIILGRGSEMAQQVKFLGTIPDT